MVTYLALMFLMSQFELAVGVTTTILIHRSEVRGLYQGDGQDPCEVFLLEWGGGSGHFSLIHLVISLR